MSTITVVTPTYRKDKLLAECGESVLAQTHRGMKWLIILDDPTDAVRSVADWFRKRDPRVTVADSGLTDSTRREFCHTSRIFNLLVPELGSKYVLPLGDDDLLTSEALELLVGAAEREKRHVVYGHAECLVETNKGWRVDVPLKPTTEFHYSTEWPACRLDWSQVMHTVEAFRQCGPKPYREYDPAAGGDYLFFNLLACHHRFLCVPEITLIHRTCHESWSAAGPLFKNEVRSV